MGSGKALELVEGREGEARHALARFPRRVADRPVAKRFLVRAVLTCLDTKLEAVRRQVRNRQSRFLELLRPIRFARAHRLAKPRPVLVVERLETHGAAE